MIKEMSNNTIVIKQENELWWKNRLGIKKDGKTIKCGRIHNACEVKMFLKRIFSNISWNIYKFSQASAPFFFLILRNRFIKVYFPFFFLYKLMKFFFFLLLFIARFSPPSLTLVDFVLVVAFGGFFQNNGIWVHKKRLWDN